MSRRRLKRALTRLLLAAPLLPASACIGPVTSCDGFDAGPPQERTFQVSGTTGPDGGEWPSDMDCHDLCQQVSSMAVSREHPCTVNASDAGPPGSVTCSVTAVCEGRRPEGLSRALARGSDPVGLLWAQIAHLEAASVPVFERLAAELSTLGAPARLVRAALRAAADEVRHARLTRALAGRYGAEAPAVEVAPFEARTLEALARENAVEGCVREGYGALLTGWQARRASSPAVREVLGGIVKDELSHALLAWEVDAWARGHLSAEACARVDAARDEALRALRDEIAASVVAPRLVSEAGMPTRAQALELVDGLARAMAEERARAA